MMKFFSCRFNDCATQTAYSQVGAEALSSWERPPRILTVAGFSVKACVSRSHIVSHQKHIGRAS